MLWENHTALDNKIASLDKTKFSGESIKHAILQTSINDHRRKLKIQINLIEIEGLVDTGKDMTIWHQYLGIPHWLFQEVNIQILGNETLFQIKQSTL